LLFESLYKTTGQVVGQISSIKSLNYREGRYSLQLLVASSSLLLPSQILLLSWTLVKDQQRQYLQRRVYRL